MSEKLQGKEKVWSRSGSQEKLSLVNFVVADGDPQTLADR